jgi:hypothetical protein
MSNIMYVTNNTALHKSTFTFNALERIGDYLCRKSELSIKNCFNF